MHDILLHKGVFRVKMWLVVTDVTRGDKTAMSPIVRLTLTADLE